MVSMARLSAIRAVLIGVAAAGVAACAASVPLDRAVLAYDRKTVDGTSLLLLENIARARHNLPMHFTTVSSIAATYKYSFSGGVGPAMTGDKGYLVLPNLTGSTEENPTITLAPMQGDEFTQRLLTPFPEQKLTLLLRQGYDVDALLRLLGAEIRIRDETGAMKVFNNRPSDREGYRVYRRIMSHFSSIQDLHALSVDPLHFEYVWSVPEASVTPESYLASYKDLSLTPDPAHKAYRVARRVNGRVMITNYDPSVLTNEERFRLHEEAEGLPGTDILIDIRPGYPGGAMPLHGTLRLRSFHEVLTFIGRGIAEEPEFDVPPDVRTPPVTENPRRALEIVESREPPASGVLSVNVNGLYYSVRTLSGYPWNEKAFNMLSQLYQMTVTAVPQAGPAITISK